VLTDELAWKKGVPLFVAGRLAALRLGPGAGNLEGARGGAERIAWGVGDVLEGVERERERVRRRSVVGGKELGREEGKTGETLGLGTEVGNEDEDGSADDGDDAEYCYHAGIGSRYASLVDDDGDDDGDGENESDKPRAITPAALDEEPVMRGEDGDKVTDRQIPRAVADLSLG